MCCLLHQCVPNFLISSLSFSYRRYFGVIVPHKKAAIFSARRSELIDVMDQTLHYLDPKAMVRIYSPYSDVPRYVSVVYYICHFVVIRSITDRGPWGFHVCFTHSLLPLHYCILVSLSFFLYHFLSLFSLFHYLTPSLSHYFISNSPCSDLSLSLSLSISFSNSLFSSSSTYLSSFLKMGLTWSLFCYFSFFSNTDFTEKNCRSQRDSNSGRRSTRRARWPLDHHHGPNLPLFLSLSLSPSLLPVGTSLPSIFFLLALFILYLFYIEILPPPLSLSLSFFSVTYLRLNVLLLFQVQCYYNFYNIILLVQLKLIY